MPYLYFCDLRQLTVNLGETKVTILTFISTLEGRRLRSRAHTHTWEYNSLDPNFISRPTLHPGSPRAMDIYPFSRDSVSVTTFMRSHLRCPSWSLIRPTVLYGSEILGPSLLEFDWALVERVQTLLLWRIIRCKQDSSSMLNFH
jgi:hypothetical protein